MKGQIKIVCLPVAGEADPTQHLIMQGLNTSDDILAIHGIDDRFFGIIRSAIIHKPHFIHFDWIESYYLRRYRWLTFLSISILFFQMYICKYLLQIKFGWTIHNIYPHDRKDLKIKIWVLQKFASIVHFLRVLSPESIEVCANTYKVNKNKIHFVGFGDYTNFYPNKVSRQEARTILGVPDNARILLTLGSIKKYKGIPTYLQTIKNLNHPNLLLLIVGKCVDPKLEEEIIKHLNTNIIYKNVFIPKEELQNYYNAADLVVMPFLDIENSGSVVMTMGFKKTIVAPKSNVLNYRLKYQSEFQYEQNTLDLILTKALDTPQSILEEFGEHNFKQLQENKWTDFNLLFYKYNH